MSSATYILAHDLGTTGDKATLIDPDGRPVATAYEGYGTAYPHPNWAEQDAADWERALAVCTQRLLAQSAIAPGRIAAVSFSGHMQGALVVDRQGAPLRPAIIWADQRATLQAERMAIAGAERVYHLSGHRVSPAYTAAKVMWIKDNQPEIYRRSRYVMQPKDYAAWLLTGVFATDYSDASGTQVFDLRERRWSEELLGAFELRREIFPPAHPSTAVIGRVTPRAAQVTGLLAGTPVVIGGGDGACATVGAAVIRAGDAYTYIGSSSWLALSTSEPIFDPQQRIMNFAALDPALYFSLGNMQAAGGAFDWLERLLRDEGAPDSRHAALDALAAQAPPGANGVLCLPYLLGERSPHWNPHARAAFVGLSMSHGRAEMIRAVLEGVAFNMRWILDVLRSLVGPGGIKAMRVIGGGMRSALWRQILADVYGVALSRPQLDSAATSLGAAIAGGIGVGLFPDFSVVERLIPVAPAESPDPQRAAIYERMYPLFQQTYMALKPVFDGLVALG
ncbi:MAG: xylulokinase [Chloroflexi bacterium]|nr:xylulokinase [Chloroflexota bacterium]MCL5275997.1 xylulokinase [Chloroflexota bacterium]